MQPYDDMQGVDLPVPNDPANMEPVDIELARSSSGLAARSIDVYQTPHEIVVESAVAGVEPESLDITATPDSIAIKGERQRRKEVRDEDYLYQECYWGRFSRSVILPQEVDPDNATVAFKNGILTVRLPKVHRKKSRKLKVSAD
jgi:HSP20 family protein